MGARWKHRSTGFVVRITGEFPSGGYGLALEGETIPAGVVEGPFGPRLQEPTFIPPDPMAQYITHGAFTAEVIIRDFDSLDLSPDRWDQILDNADETD